MNLYILSRFLRLCDEGMFALKTIDLVVDGILKGTYACLIVTLYLTACPRKLEGDELLQMGLGPMRERAGIRGGMSIVVASSSSYRKPRF